MDKPSWDKNLFAYCDNDPINRVDNGGDWWNWIAGAVVGAVVGATVKIVSNAVSGKEWNDDLLGAVVGGAVYGGIVGGTGNLAVASYAGAAAESLTNEVVSYTPIAKYNGQEQKALTKSNLKSSAKKIVKDTAVDGTISLISGKVANNAVPIGATWIKPTKIASRLFGSYARKIWAQEAWGVASSGIMNAILSRDGMRG